MSGTPEGKVKLRVKNFLWERGLATLSHPVHTPVGFFRMHVPSGYGEPALDFEGAYKGRMFAVETKAEGNTPSAMQKLIIKMHHNALVFSIWGDDADSLIKQLDDFFTHVDTLA